MYGFDMAGLGSTVEATFGGEGNLPGQFGGGGGTAEHCLVTAMRDRRLADRHNENRQVSELRMVERVGILGEGRMSWPVEHQRKVLICSDLLDSHGGQRARMDQLHPDGFCTCADGEGRVHLRKKLGEPGTAGPGGGSNLSLGQRGRNTRCGGGRERAIAEKFSAILHKLIRFCIL